MRKLLLTGLLLSFCASAHAAELTKVTDHAHGWSYLFVVTIKTKEDPKGRKLPIEIPLNKCGTGVSEKNCFSTKHEATNAAWASVKKMERTMRESFKGSAP